MTKALYRLALKAVDHGEFQCARKGAGTDLVNRYLDHGNYLAYGLGATAVRVLTLPRRQSSRSMVESGAFESTGGSLQNG